MANSSSTGATQRSSPKGLELPRRNKPAPPANFVLPRPVRIPSPPNQKNSRQKGSFRPCPGCGELLPTRDALSAIR